jgi:hypothetical protein
MSNRLDAIDVHLHNLLVVLALFVRELVIRRVWYVCLLRALKSEELVHLIHAQTLGVVDKEERKNTRTYETRGEEDIYAPLHIGVHAGKALCGDQSPDPDRCRGKRAGNGAQRRREDFCGNDPRQTIGYEKVSNLVCGTAESEI